MASLLPTPVVIRCSSIHRVSEGTEYTLYYLYLPYDDYLTVQANKWIKNMEKKNDLKVLKQTDSNYMQVMEVALTYGQPVLLENVGE